MNTVMEPVMDCCCRSFSATLLLKLVSASANSE